MVSVAVASKIPSPSSVTTDRHVTKRKNFAWNLWCTVERQSTTVSGFLVQFERCLAFLYFYLRLATRFHTTAPVNSWRYFEADLTTQFRFGPSPSCAYSIQFTSSRFDVGLFGLPPHSLLIPFHLRWSERQHMAAAECLGCPSLQGIVWPDWISLQVLRSIFGLYGRSPARLMSLGDNLAVEPHFTTPLSWCILVVLNPAQDTDIVLFLLYTETDIKHFPRGNRDPI